MAFENRKIARNRYTCEDIQILVDSLVWWVNGVGVDSGVFEEFANVQIREHTRKLYLHTIEDFVDGRLLLDPALNFFLQGIPLEDVPLYLNDYPEFARWRLMIAK